jgi:phosphatidylserine/phosphatidylglycerophosphate/cardiolipin synthase-like enzyme
LDARHGTIKESSRTGRAALIDAGAELKVCSGIHNKSIAVDERILIEGSFNWLSASRNPNSAFARHEVSIAMWDQDDEGQGPYNDSSSNMDGHVLPKRRSVVAENIASLINELDERPCGSFRRAKDS